MTLPSRDRQLSTQIRQTASEADGAHLSPPTCTSSNSSHWPRTSGVMAPTLVCMEPPQAWRTRCPLHKLHVTHTHTALTHATRYRLHTVHVTHSHHTQRNTDSSHTHPEQLPQPNTRYTHTHTQVCLTIMVLLRSSSWTRPAQNRSLSAKYCVATSPMGSLDRTTLAPELWIFSSLSYRMFHSASTMAWY